MKDRIDDLKEKLQKVVSGFDQLKACGINDEILIAYIKDKTKLSERDVKKVLDRYEEFYSTLIKKEIMKKMVPEQK